MSTKIHVTVDALGNPLRLLLSGGQVADITLAQNLIAGLTAQAVVGDKGYDADALMECIEQSGAQVVIPPKVNRIVQRSYVRHIYKDRNLIERFFNRINNSDASPRDTTNWPETTSPRLISSALTSGQIDC